MTTAVRSRVQNCPACGAQCSRFCDQCWLCKADLNGDEVVVTAELVSQPPAFALQNVAFAVLTCALILVVIAVGIGAFMESPGAGVGFAIVTLPALIAAVVRVLRRQEQQPDMTSAERITTFGSSFIMWVALICAAIGLLTVAVVVGLVVFCFVAIAASS